MRDRIGGDDDRGGADGGAEIGGDLRQQRIGDPNLAWLAKAAIARSTIERVGVAGAGEGRNRRGHGAVFAVW